MPRRLPPRSLSRLRAHPCCARRSATRPPGSAATPPVPSADSCQPVGRRGPSMSCSPLNAAGAPSLRIRPAVGRPCPLAGCRQTRSSVVVAASLLDSSPLWLHRLSPASSLLRVDPELFRHRALVVAFLGPTACADLRVHQG